MAALSAVTRLVRTGQEIILNNDSYGGTYRLLSKVKNEPQSNARCPIICNIAYAVPVQYILISSPTTTIPRILFM